MIELLCDELLAEISSHLLFSESYVQLMMTCKTWYNILNDEWYIQMLEKKIIENGVERIEKYITSIGFDFSEFNEYLLRWNALIWGNFVEACITNDDQKGTMNILYFFFHDELKEQQLEFVHTYLGEYTNVGIYQSTWSIFPMCAQTYPPVKCERGGKHLIDVILYKKRHQEQNRYDLLDVQCRPEKRIIFYDGKTIKSRVRIKDMFQFYLVSEK